MMGLEEVSSEQLTDETERELRMRKLLVALAVMSLACGDDPSGPSKPFRLDFNSVEGDWDSYTSVVTEAGCWQGQAGQQCRTDSSFVLVLGTGTVQLADSSQRAASGVSTFTVALDLTYQVWDNAGGNCDGFGIQCFTSQPPDSVHATQVNGTLTVTESRTGATLELSAPVDDLGRPGLITDIGQEWSIVAASYPLALLGGGRVTAGPIYTASRSLAHH